jgi:predicted DNA-binding transcriptional regulator AlpA
MGRLRTLNAEGGVTRFCGFGGFWNMCRESQKENRAVNNSREKLLIDIHELSALTGISVGTLYHWASERRLPCVRLSNRCLRFFVPAVREWLANLNEPARAGTFYGKGDR